MAVTNAVILAYPGVEELDLFGAYAPLVKAELPVTIAAAQPEFVCSGGASVRRQSGLEAVAAATALVLPGGAGVHEAARDPRLAQAVRQAYELGARLYAICSGAFLLGRLAKDLPVSVHAAKQDLLATATGCVPTSGLVRHGRIASIGGRAEPGVKAVSMAFQLLRDLAPESVDRVAARLEVVP